MKDILSYLRCFECASRYQSFTKASEELCITQSAVSQQMRALSSHLGIALFRRSNNRLYLTFEGKRLAARVRESLAAIDDEIAELLAREPNTTFTIRVDPVFANSWLIPKLDIFEAQLADSRIGLQVSEFDRGDADTGHADVPEPDVMIELEPCEKPGSRSVPMAADEIIAVCSPHILRSGQTYMTEKQLMSESLLAMSDSDLTAKYGMDFARWKVQVGVREKSTGQVELYPSVELMLQAAIHNRGIALIRRVLADDDVRAGRLVTAFERSANASGRFHISWNELGAEARNALEFVEFVQSEQRGSS